MTASRLCFISSFTRKGHKVNVVVLLLLSACSSAYGQTSFSYDFTDTGVTPAMTEALGSAGSTAAMWPTSVSIVQTNTDGSYNSSTSYARTLRLTAAAANEYNAIWYDNTIDLTRGFSTNFQFAMHSPTSSHVDGCRVNADINVYCTTRGGDGIAFVIQADSRAKAAVGEAGGHLGYGGDTNGITNSYAIELDSWFNHDFLDAGFNHVAVHSKGREKNSGDTRYSIGYHGCTPDLADGSVHNVTINLHPSFKLFNDDFVDANFIQTEYGMTEGTIFSDNGMWTLEVFVDDLTSPVLTTAVHIPDSIGSTQAYVGFTGSTGKSYQAQELLYWSFSQS